MIKYYLGFDSDYLLLGVLGFAILLLIFILINMIQMHKLKKKYKKEILSTGFLRRFRNQRFF